MEPAFLLPFFRLYGVPALQSERVALLTPHYGLLCLALNAIAQRGDFADALHGGQAACPIGGQA